MSEQIEDLITPYLPGNPVIDAMWIGCLRWAIGEQGCLDAFRTDTGFNWTPGRTTLDRMIDDATGMDHEFIAAFVPWFAANVWGDEMAEADEAVPGKPSVRYH